MKSFLLNQLHSLILPRGKAYKEEKGLDDGWDKYFVQGNKKHLCCLSKKTELTSCAVGIVILCHPYLSDAKQYYLKNGHAEVYLALGFNVILFDFNGFGESSFHNFSYEEDIALVVKDGQTKNPNLPIYGHGISFGAANIIVYAAMKNSSFDKIIIENCLNSNLNYYKVRKKSIYYLMKGMMKVFPKINKNHDYTIQIGKNAVKREVLFLYNTDDSLTTIEMGHQLAASCRSPYQFEVFAGQHLEAISKERSRYIAVLKSFYHSGNSGLWV